MDVKPGEIPLVNKFDILNIQGIEGQLMMIPTGVKRMGGTVRFGYIIAALLVISLIIAFWHAPAAAALKLPSASLSLPLGGTALAPITDTLNNVTSKLPVLVTLQNTSGTVGADIDTGIALPLFTSQSSPPTPLQVGADVTLPSIIPDTLQTVLPTVAAANTPAPAQPTGASVQNNNSQANKTTDTLAGDDERSAAAIALEPVFVGVANFFGSTIPSAVQNVVKSFTGKEVDTFPIIVSTGVFLVMMAIIVGITYIMNNRGLISMSNTRLGQLVQSYDLTQISILVVVTVGAGAIAIYLAMSQS